MFLIPSLSLPISFQRKDSFLTSLRQQIKWVSEMTSVCTVVLYYSMSSSQAFGLGPTHPSHDTDYRGHGHDLISNNKALWVKSLWPLIHFKLKRRKNWEMTLYYTIGVCGCGPVCPVCCCSSDQKELKRERGCWFDGLWWLACLLCCAKEALILAAVSALALPLWSPPWTPSPQANTATCPSAPHSLPFTAGLPFSLDKKAAQHRLAAACRPMQLALACLAAIWPFSRSSYP